MPRSRDYAKLRPATLPVASPFAQVPQTVEMAQIAELPKPESVIESPPSREETIVAQVAELAGVDPCVAKMSLSDADGDIGKTVVELLDAKKQQQAREEADRLQAAEWQQ
jgi:hypothetical protein